MDDKEETRDSAKEIKFTNVYEKVCLLSKRALFALGRVGVSGVRGADVLVCL